MDILIKSAVIVDESSSHHLSSKDILIINGKIEKIATSINALDDVKIIEASDLHISQGWIDLSANLQDPGFEHKEDLRSGLKAAAAGGFTAVALSPLTDPIRDSKTQVEYALNASQNSVVKVLPLGSVSRKSEGKELAELNDMHESGAVAFSDGKRSIKNPNLLNRALLYSKSFDGLIINYPHTEEIAHKGVMNEGIVSTRLGLAGIAELAEELMVGRDLQILRYTGGKLHFNCISSSKSIELIAAAKKEGLNVSCDIASYNLLLDEEMLESFDSRLKTLPPLRSSATINVLKKAIKNGVIDGICSDHLPEDIESKKKEFDHAAFGIINLQTSFAAANQALKEQQNISEIISMFTTRPASVLNIKRTPIEEGKSADLCLFCPNTEFTFSKDQVHSKSLNSPFFEMSLSGKVVGVVRGKKTHWN